MQKLSSLLKIMIIIVCISPFISTQFAHGELEADYSINAMRKLDLGPRDWIVYREADISFIASSNEGENFTWDFGDGTSPVTKETSVISHSFITNGRFMVVLTTNDGDQNSVAVFGNITVVDRPQAILRITDELGNDLGPNIRMMEGESVILDASDSQGTIRTYIFGYNLPHAFLPQVQRETSTYTHRYDKPGTYTVGIRVTDTLGNSSQLDQSEFIQITVIHVPNNDDDDTIFSPPIILLIVLFISVLCVGIVFAVMNDQKQINHMNSKRSMFNSPDLPGYRTRSSEEILTPIGTPIIPSYEEPIIRQLPLSDGSGEQLIEEEPPPPPPDTPPHQYNTLLNGLNQFLRRSAIDTTRCNTNVP